MKFRRHDFAYLCLPESNRILFNSLAKRVKCTPSPRHE